MRRRERMVKMPPIDGSMCKTEVAEVEKCMMPECRELKIMSLLIIVCIIYFLRLCNLYLWVSADTIPCMLSPWLEWSECSVTCGRGVRTRQRMLKSDPAECMEELEQTEKCMLPECRKLLKYKTAAFHFLTFCPLF